MKKYLKFSGIVAAVLAVVAFILLMATTGVYYQYGNTQYNYEGTVVLFGATKETWLGTSKIAPAATGLIGWILVIVALVIILLGIILPLLKVNKLDKFAGVLNLAAVVALVVAGVLIFVSKPVFCSANNWNAEDAHLGAGWIVAGILAILAGVCAILPAAVDFIGKKK